MQSSASSSFERLLRMRLAQDRLAPSATIALTSVSSSDIMTHDLSLSHTPRDAATPRTPMDQYHAAESGTTAPNSDNGSMLALLLLVTLLVVMWVRSRMAPSSVVPGAASALAAQQEAEGIMLQQRYGTK